MNKLKLDILRILNNNYKKKTQKVSEEILDVIKSDIDGECITYTQNFLKEQILELAKKIKAQDGISDNNRSNIITLS